MTRKSKESSDDKKVVSTEELSEELLKKLTPKEIVELLLRYKKMFNDHETLLEKFHLEIKTLEETVESQKELLEEKEEEINNMRNSFENQLEVIKLEETRKAELRLEDRLKTEREKIGCIYNGIISELQGKNKILEEEVKSLKDSNGLKLDYKSDSGSNDDLEPEHIPTSDRGIEI